jgi:Sulfotransferase family
MKVDEVLVAAQKRAGLTDVDSDSWRAGLAVILEEIEGPPVTDDGRNLVVGRCVDALANRLRVHDYITQHPEVRGEEVERPLFILGMPRTGTTVASYLLDQDPARRSLLKWEAVNTVPPATPETLRTDPRCLEMKEVDAMILDLLKGSGNGVPHWEEADGPTECMFLHEQDFKGLLWDAFTPTTRYADWLLDEADLTSTYEYQKVILQILQAAVPGTWSLKMPSHAVHLDTLLEVFPDAQLVWAHRDPFKATGSLCNLLMTPGMMVLGEDGVDRELLGQNCKRQMREHVNRPLRVRDRIGDDRFFHLHYAELLRDPIGQMRAMYGWAGDSLTPEVEGRMRRWLDENPQHKHGVSSYSLDQYGLTLDELEPVFEDYLTAFDIELEGGA